MNIFFRELKSNLKSVLIWGFIIVFFILVGFSKFSAYYDNPELLAVMDAFPPAVMEAFNMNAFNLTTITGFLGIMFSYFGLILSIAAAMWGSDIITKEERDKTVEFSLTLPVTRGKLITAKALAAFVNCIALLGITYAGIIAGTSNYAPDAEFFEFLSLIMTAFFLMQMIFLALGLLLGCAMKNHKRSSSVAVSLMIGTYFISIISALYEKLDFLKYLSPFKYFDPGVLLRESKFDMVYIWITIGIVLVSLIGAYTTYSRRDLYI